MSKNKPVAKNFTVQIIESGGFSGKTVKFPIIDVSSLPKMEQQTLMKLINNIKFFELPEKILTKGYDIIVTTLIITKDGKTHKVSIDFVGENPIVRKMEPLLDEIHHIYEDQKEQESNKNVVGKIVSFGQEVKELNVKLNEEFTLKYFSSAIHWPTIHLSEGLHILHEFDENNEQPGSSNSHFLIIQALEIGMQSITEIVKIPNPEEGQSPYTVYAIVVNIK